MTIYDISVPLATTTPTYPGDPAIEVSSWMELDRGDAANVSLLHFGAHSGTHVDAPAHFIASGAMIAELDLAKMMGEAVVIEVPSNMMAIDEDFINAYCDEHAKRILFKTRNSSFWNNPEAGFRTDYTYLTPAAAARLAKMEVELVGIDYLSIEQFQSKSFETHLNLLTHDVVILEGLDLRNVSAETYELICLPLRIASGLGDGAPARALLRTTN